MSWYSEQETDTDLRGFVPPLDPLDDDRDQENPCEYSEDFDWSKHDFDSDPDWR